SGIGIAAPFFISLLTKKTEESVVSSLSSVGPNFGCIVLPFLLKELIFRYGLNGCYSIMSGIILNCLPFILIITYKIKISCLRTKWSFRSKSKRYRMAKKDKVDGVSTYKPKDVKAFCNQSFIQNLEPDVFEKVSESGDPPSAPFAECIDILKPIIEAKMKMEQQQTCDREPFGLDQMSKDVKCCQEEEIPSEELPSNVHGEENYEKDDVLLKGVAKSVSEPENEKDCSTVSDNVNNKEVTINNAVNINSAEVSNVINEEKTSEKDEAESEKEDSPPIIPTTDQTFQIKKELSPPSANHGTNFPLEIKVHVVECTITTTEEGANFLRNQEPTVKRNGYRRHSNSLITACYENIDFTQLLGDKSSPLQKQQWNTASRMYLISEEDEYDHVPQRTLSECREAEVQTDYHSTSKLKNVVQSLQVLARPSYFAIIYASVIYEFSQAVLLTIFGDFAKDTGDMSVTSNMVLVAYGLGGIVGQLSFTNWGSRFLADGSHAAAAVIFMLNGLAVAGILWSVNVSWLSGFYALLGFLERGVTMVLPRLVADYTEQKTERLLSGACKCLSALAFLCIPCAI
ncbi:uncharacterized protein NPIL_584611, partial [Nephila pilipes]